jgi:hypothetical protein
LIALINRPATEAVVQVLANGLSLFRTKLLIQIFPEPDQNFFTFHPSNPRKMHRRWWPLPPEQRTGLPGS